MVSISLSTLYASVLVFFSSSSRLNREYRHDFILSKTKRQFSCPINPLNRYKYESILIIAYRLLNMRKIYYRRFLLLPILFFCCIVLIITFLSLIPNSIWFPCAKNSLDSSSTIPPNYLLVPYREFVLRTSISCQPYKLATPQKRLSQLHPSHSPYLRGTFPYVVPNSNITFNDIEEFYTKILVNKSNTTDSIDKSFAENITFENIPYKFRHDMWHPIGITSAQRTAILIPLQGRDYNAKTFIFNIHAFARRQLLTYQLFLIEQISPLGHRFNKGRLFNAAIRYIREETALNITCLILHDVDLIPEHDGNFYSCEPNHPKHTTIRVRPVLSTQSYTRFYEFLIGGVLLLSFDMYQNVNGFSNSYWGWGGEDDDLSLRFIERRMCVVRPSNDTAIYAGKNGKYTIFHFDYFSVYYL